MNSFICVNKQNCEVNNNFLKGLGVCCRWFDVLTRLTAPSSILYVVE